jgi:hypothetical protein
MLSRHPVALGGIFISGILLAGTAFSDSPDQGAWESLMRILYIHGHQSIFAVPEDTTPNTGLIPMNIMLLPYLFTRHGTLIGTGLIGFIGYVSIGFSTYALSRRYSWPPTAVTISMVVMSLPRFVSQAVSPGDEIVPAAVALFCILGIYRVAEQPNMKDLLLLALGILFGISGGVLSFVFPLILAALSVVILLRRHGTSIWMKMVRDHWKIICLWSLPAFFFSQSWMILWNYLHYGTWIGRLNHEWSYNKDGIFGAFANLTRYFSEGIHLIRLGMDLILELFGISAKSLLSSLFDQIFWIVGNRGASVSFSFSHLSGLPFSGFGPFGLILIWPAVIYTLFKGPQNLKAVAWGLLVYVYMVALIPAWTPFNIRYFSHFYACGGFLTSIMLPPWRFTKKGKITIQIICIGLLAGVLRRLI